MSDEESQASDSNDAQNGPGEAHSGGPSQSQASWQAYWFPEGPSEALRNGETVTPGHVDVNGLVSPNLDAFGRPLILPRVRHIAESWDPAKVHVLAIALWEGELWVVDGNHRFWAAKNRGVKRLRANLHEHFTQARLAELFSGLNDFTRPSALSLFWADVTARRATALNLLKVIEASGYTVAHLPNETKPGPQARRIRNIDTFRTIADQHGLKYVRETLQFIDSLWGGSPKSLRHGLLMAVSGLLHYYPNDELNRHQLIGRLQQRTTLGSLLGRGADLKEREGVAEHIALATVMLRIYDYGRPEAKRLPSWQERVRQRRARPDDSPKADSRLLVRTDQEGFVQDVHREAS